MDSTEDDPRLSPEEPPVGADNRVNYKETAKGWENTESTDNVSDGRSKLSFSVYFITLRP